MNDDTDSTLHRTALDHLIRRTIANAVGDTQAERIDLDQVDRIGDHVLGIGRPTVDGCVTITSSDRVTVWRDGDDVATAHLPGAFAHYAGRADR